MESFERVEQLLGSEALSRLQSVRVIVFGVGGVGGWCAESLVRSGVRRLTLVDFDNVAPSNINRQVMATSLTVGQPKVDVLRKRLMEINPAAEITALQKRYEADTAQDFDLGAYDYVIDAIDSLDSKALLILNTLKSPAMLLSSMGAARKLDPGQVSVAEFWKVQGCPLARALRQKFKKQGELPQRKFRCVYSPEPPVADGGTLMQVTAAFGLRLTSLLVSDIIGKNTRYMTFFS